MDLNTATEQELCVIQGIGKDNAQKIVQHRLQNGSFKTWEDLKRIPGLPPHMPDTLKRCRQDRSGGSGAGARVYVCVSQYGALRSSPVSARYNLACFISWS
jgi:competence ComEA-like helix-hairpin-helix protein